MTSVLSLGSLLVTVLMISNLVGCAKERAILPERIYIQDLSKEAEAQKQTGGRQLTGALDSSEIGACDRVEQLTVTLGEEADPPVEFSSQGSRRNFRLMEELDLLGKTGKGDLLNSPFLQVLLAEKFVVPTDDQFIGLLNQKCAQVTDEGEQRKCQFVNCLYDRISEKELSPVCVAMIGEMKKEMAQKQFTGAKLAGVNISLNETFPGVFGDTSSLTKSLYGLLIAKLRIAPSAENLAGFQVLTRKLALFSGASWTQQANETKISLAAALQGLYNTKNLKKVAAEKEKLCGFVLLHRNFAQLLALKGHYRPEFYDEENVVFDGTAQVPIFSLEVQEEILPKPVAGLFNKLTISDGEDARILSIVDIANYNPRKGLILAAHQPPKEFYLDKPKGFRPAAMEETLGAFEALLAQFTVTSPAGPWIDKDLKNYVYGNIESKKNLAVLPAEVHSLSLGLMSVILTNFSAMNLKTVDRNKKLTTEAKKISGIVIGEAAGLEKGIVNIAFRNLLSFLRGTINLRLELKRLAGLSREKLLAINPVYSDKKLAQIFGTDIFTKAELEKLLTDAEKPLILVDRLKALALPLVTFVGQFRLPDGACAQTMNWDLNAGTQTLKGKCSVAQEKERKRLLKRLSVITNSVLW